MEEANESAQECLRIARESDLPVEVVEEIIALKRYGYGTRRIAPRVARSRKKVRSVLEKAGLLGVAPETMEKSKLKPFEEIIEEKVKKGLSTSRILHEIRELGYSGGRTILADHARGLRVQLAVETTRAKKVHRRFETEPGKEMQIDWSPYTVRVAGAVEVVHALGVLLCWSRKLFLYFFAHERQSMLLEGMAMAFEYFDGCAIEVVLDNMTTAIVTRYGPDGQAVFQDAFLDFSKHYGFRPIPCHVRSPDRKGKKEKSFRLVESDFLRGSEFASLDDLNVRAKEWLDHKPERANQRVHGTTRRVPNEAYLAERAFLIRLPERRFPVYEDTIRVVDSDCTLSVRGNRYSVPSSLANRSVRVLQYAEHFDVLNPNGATVSSQRYMTAREKGSPRIDESHYASLPRRTVAGQRRLHQVFLDRFPTLQPLVSGLFEKMKSLTHIHVRSLLRLADSYGEAAFVAAATKAQEHRRFDARAVERILESEHGPPSHEDDLDAPLGGIGPARLGPVESGSLDDYGYLDEHTTDDDGGASGQEH